MTSRSWAVVGIAAALFALLAGSLFFMGQPTICECGYVKVWEGVVESSGTSQHLADWDTFSHVIHGLLFYLGLWLLFPRMSIAKRFLIALAVEVGWEVFENTPWLIEHYREQALARGYTGDSIVNSISDTLAMCLGFFLAWRRPVAASVTLAIAFEAFVGYSVRDNLTLNIVNLVYPFEFIAEWQTRG